MGSTRAPHALRTGELDIVTAAGARGAAIGKGAAIVDEQQRSALAMSRCRLVLPVCVASAG
jgi:hypothetical protein